MAFDPVRVLKTTCLDYVQGASFLVAKGYRPDEGAEESIWLCQKQRIGSGFDPRRVLKPAAHTFLN